VFYKCKSYVKLKIIELRITDIMILRFRFKVKAPSYKIDRSALFVSAEGRKVEGIRKIISIISSNGDRIPKMFLRYSDIEATARINKGTEKIIFNDFTMINFFEDKGELKFLEYLNDRQYELIQSRISSTKNQLSSNTDMGKANLLKKIIEDDERLLIEFKKWFISNDLIIPKTRNNTFIDRTNTRTAGLEPNLSIDNMHSIKFIKSKCAEYSDQVVFKIYNDDFETPEIKISQMDGSLLLFLAAERKKNEEKWLLSPNKYENVLLSIFNDLQLRKAREYSDIVWAKKDTKNSRYKITSRINKTVQEAGFLSGNLIINKQVDDYVKGIYSLSESIKNIEYSDQTGL